MEVRSLVCGWSSAFYVRYVLQFSVRSQAWEATGPLETGPPTGRKAMVQMWIAFPPTAPSCFQLAQYP